ncbi:Glycosyl transferase family 2 [Chryseobacterium sp. RU37D]|uniref:glycosyltransferase family 2 protein n=1 Tax=Chryseobacterium sp. RU37D TaxID=1907397 RepID=UPI0009558D36|nr:glycosyltransferase family A protein [Chryseobacterium sp. RU37D]SIQ67805.1 Glycosyl transferase family 2 [Chryseobacterium sp. RU37D]
MEKDTLKLSIIIPVYNTPLPYVKECLESIEQSQIKYPYEIIIINDGSTDVELLHFLQEYKNPNAVMIHKENSGVSASRNVGLKRAKGKYILCLDSDDKLLPTINNAIAYLDYNSTYDVLYCDLQAFGDTEFLHKKCEFSMFQLIYISNMLTPSSTLFKKELSSKVFFNENLSFSEDRDFFARAAVLGFSFKCFKLPFCLYRRIYNSQSLSQKYLNTKDEVESFIKSQFNPHKVITQEEVNQYVINNFTTHKKHIIKLLLIIFFPSLFTYFKYKKLYKNNIVID